MLWKKRTGDRLREWIDWQSLDMAGHDVTEGLSEQMTVMVLWYVNAAKLLPPVLQPNSNQDASVKKLCWCNKVVHQWTLVSNYYRWTWLKQLGGLRMRIKISLSLRDKTNSQQHDKNSMPVELVTHDLPFLKACPTNFRLAKPAPQSH